MRLLTKDELIKSLDSRDNDSLHIEPLLDRNQQIGAVSVDLRLGYDFLVSILTRQPAIEVSPPAGNQRRGVGSFFQETRRRVGERFILYPHQAVLTTTLEYLSLPNKILADVSIRSSYGRLGLSLNTSIQPGWRGTVSLEIFNHGNTPIEMVVGSCVCQARFYELDDGVAYGGNSAPWKYFGTVRPTVSRVSNDQEFQLLAEMHRSA